MPPVGLELTIYCLEVWHSNNWATWGLSREIAPNNKLSSWYRFWAQSLIFSANFYKSSFTIPSIVQNPPIPTSQFFLCAERRYRVIWNIYSLRPAWTSYFSISIQRKVILPYGFALIDESVWKLMKWFTKLSDLNHF